MPTVTLPPKRPGGDAVAFDSARSIVIVGANGSGKTRLGAFVEKRAGEKSHRISAQRSLNVPRSVQPRSHEQAESSLLFGGYQPKWSFSQQASQKDSQRWGNEPEISILNDYEHLLAFLFADETKRNRDYSRAALTVLPTSQPPKCKLDALSEIWKAGCLNAIL